MIASKHIDALERVLRELLAEHETLVTLAARHREALRRADGPAVTEVSLERDRVNERIVSLNGERQEMTRAIAGELGAHAEGMTVRTLIAALAPDRAARLAALADELRSAIEATRREHSAV